MTMPSEQVSALKRTRDFLRSILLEPRRPQFALKAEACSCLRHFPFDYVIDDKWSDEVCVHGEDGQWCPECKHLMVGDTLPSPKSGCCNAGIELNKGGTTRYYICSECGKACDEKVTLPIPTKEDAND